MSMSEYYPEDNYDPDNPYPHAGKSIEELINENKHNHPTTLCPTTEEAKEQSRWFLDHAYVKLSYDDVMMLVTIFVLFGDDLRLTSFPSSSDETFLILNSLSFFLFLFELILNIFAKTELIIKKREPKSKPKVLSKKSKKLTRPPPKTFRSQFHLYIIKPFKEHPLTLINFKGYLFSFFFWLDLIALLSIVFEIPWLQAIFGVEEMLASADSASFRAGRVVRMIRLVRLVKLYKITSQRRREKRMLGDLKNLVDQGRMTEEDVTKYFNKMSHQKQSKVGAELVDMITRKVIICVLFMLLMVPLLTIDEDAAHFKLSVKFVHESSKSFDYSPAANLVATSPACVNLEYQVTQFMSSASAEYSMMLLDVTVTPDPCNVNDIVSGMIGDFSLSNLRDEFTEVVCYGEGSDFSVCSVFDITDDAKEDSMLSMLLTLFVIVILITMSMAFENDAQKLVLSPIEQMMSMINMVADDPLVEYTFQSTQSAGEYETKVVQVAIQKITTLLRIGFGVAGAEIISKNMSVENGRSAGLDPMIPGKRMYAIFGFCDIHEFDMCTEVLEDEIMNFVNTVARIVHEEVCRWGGACNKNLGNAFLMVWRIGDEEDLLLNSNRKRLASTMSEAGGAEDPLGDGEVPAFAAVNLRRVPGLDDMSDKALIGFLKVVVEINRDTQALDYRNDPRLSAQGHGDNYKLRMGFGLHVGWAIEGAVGSLQKVDATYLSPHVNMSARMEAASRQFGVCVLMTENFHELMSNEAQSKCRRLDVVTVKGSAVPMPIYTYDTFQDQSFRLVLNKFTDLSMSKTLTRQADNYTTREWNSDIDLTQLRRLATKKFNDTFKDGINTYLLGNWPKARLLLEKCDDIMSANCRDGDGPSRTILNYMKNREYECPPEWEGFRPLTSK